MKQVEITITIFTVIDKEIKMLLIKKQSEPYKGYWLIPRIMASKKLAIDESLKEILKKLNLPDVKVFQNKTISTLEKDELNYINIVYVGIIDSIRLGISEMESGFEQEWFSIKKIPKMAYNYQELVEDNIQFLRERIKKASILNLFFPSDFTFPEIQAVLEKINDVKLDRRNLRKKFINNNLVDEVNNQLENSLGRPSKLYMFKETYEDIEIL